MGKKIKIGEAVGGNFINYRISRRLARPNELENFVIDTGIVLGKIYEKLEKGKTIIFDYNLIASKDSGKKDPEFLGFMSGGFDLSVREARVYSLPEFKEQYNAFLRKVSEQKHKLPFDVYVSLIGSRDAVRREIETEF